jgi:Ca-activated chloride channel family protein
MYRDLSLSIIVFLLFSILIGLIFILVKKKKDSAFVFIGADELSAKAVANLVRALSLLFLVSGLFFVLLAFSRPQEKKLQPKDKEKGIDILFALDISDSMLIEDMAPYENRLESAKHHIKEFIAKRENDRLGLVVFSGEAYTRVPLTVDHDMLLSDISKVQVSEYIKKGTAIGVALAAAVNRVRISDTKSKVIVLLTDGENNTGVIDPLTALDLTIDLGARVYTIGIGRDGRSMLPVFSKDRFGRKVKSYRPFPTKINEELLREIAFKTDGQFYRASEESDMGRIFEDIDQLETSDFKMPDTYKVVEKFQHPLKMALISFVLLGLLELSLFWRGL